MADKKESVQETSSVSGFLCFALYSTSHAMNRVQKPFLAKLGITYTQLLVLVTLWDEDNRLVSDIGKILFLESNTLTPLLKRLEASGTINRKRDENDERKVRVTLTSKGKLMKAHVEEFGTKTLAATGMSLESYLQLESQILSLRNRLIEVSNSEKT